MSIPSPELNLEVKSESNVQQISQILQRFEPILLQEKPDAVLVVGDVNSTLACSMAATFHDIKVIHVEAGLRSFDMSMPEEINRMLTDKISDLLFVTEKSGIKNLSEEGIAPEKIHFVGNVMVDTLLKHKKLACDSSEILDKLKLEPGKFILTTLHRPSNVDQKSNLKSILESLAMLSKELPVVFPIHPRTEKKIKDAWT